MAGMKIFSRLGTATTLVATLGLTIGTTTPAFAEGLSGSGFSTTVSGKQACQLIEEELETVKRAEFERRKAQKGLMTLTGYSALGAFVGLSLEAGAKKAKLAIIRRQGKVIMREAAEKAAAITDDLTEVLLRNPHLKQHLEFIVRFIGTKIEVAREHGIELTREQVAKNIRRNHLPFLDTIALRNSVSKEFRQVLLKHFDDASVKAMAPALNQAVFSEVGLAGKALDTKYYSSRIAEEFVSSGRSASATPMNAVKTLIHDAIARAFPTAMDNTGFRAAMISAAKKVAPSASRLAYKAGAKAAGCVEKVAIAGTSTAILGVVTFGIGVIADIMISEGETGHDTEVSKLHENPARLFNARLIHPNNACRRLEEDPVLREKFALMVEIARDARQSPQAPICGGGDGDRKLSRRDEKRGLPSEPPIPHDVARNTAAERAI